MRVHILWFFICLICSVAAAAGGYSYSLRKLEVPTNVGTATALLDGSMGNYEAMKRAFDALEVGDTKRASRIVKAVASSNYSAIVEVSQKMSAAPYGILLKKKLSETKNFQTTHHADSILSDS